MLEFKDGDIILTRGDSVYIDTVILTPCEDVYEPKDKDEVYLYINDNVIILEDNSTMMDVDELDNWIKEQNE